MIQFTFTCSDLLRALNVVSIVPPKPVTPQGNAGYLFVVKGDICNVYSRDAAKVAKSSFPIRDVQGEGSFFYPYEFSGGLEFLKDSDINFQVREKDEQFTIEYKATNGARVERQTQNPNLLQSCEKQLENSTGKIELSCGVLKEALSQAKMFVSKPQEKVDEQTKTIQVFDGTEGDAKDGNGYMYASDGVKAFYFYTEAFLNHSLSIYGGHLQAVITFLNQTTGKVTLSKSSNMTFMTNSLGDALGWTHHTKTYNRFRYKKFEGDILVYDVPVALILNSLKYTASELSKGTDKIKMLINGDTLTFTAVEGSSKFASFPVTLKLVENKLSENEIKFEAFVSIQTLIEIFSGAKGDIVQFRLIPARKGDKAHPAFLRTVEEYILSDSGKVIGGSGVEEVPKDGHRCILTRFTVSRDS